MNGKAVIHGSINIVGILRHIRHKFMLRTLAFRLQVGSMSIANHWINKQCISGVHAYGSKKFTGFRENLKTT
ncbi:hypothetical protein CWC33_05990 [Idiomarina sp. X4]|nr:hypothetical protein CWC33_05990 [Idiomarina sp. X4]